MPETYLQEGADADYLLGRLRPLLTKQREAAIEALIAGFRTEVMSQQMMLGHIAVLAAVKTLQQELERLIRLGQQDLEHMRTR